MDPNEFIKGRVADTESAAEQAESPQATWTDLANPEVWERKAPPVEPLVWFPDGNPDSASYKSRVWLPRGIVAMFAGEGGVGKTRALVQLALAVATEGEWLGDWKGIGPRGLPCARGSVLYFAAEDSRASIERRWAAARHAWAADVKHRQRDSRVPPRGMSPVRVVTRDDLPKGTACELDLLPEDNTETAPTLIEALAEAAPPGCALIILDPLARLLPAGGNENDNAQATEVMDGAEALRKMVARAQRRPDEQGDLIGPTVLIAHHTSKGSKGGADAARGASAFVSGARWLANMRGLYKKESVQGTLEKRREFSGLIELEVSKTNDTARDRRLVVIDEGFLAVRRARHKEEKAAGLTQDQQANGATARRGVNVE